MGFVDAEKPAEVLSVYGIILQFVFIPLLKRYFTSAVGDSAEFLRVCIRGTGRRLEFNVNERHNQKNAEVTTLFLHNPVSFCFRILLDAKIGLGESFMQGHWDASPSPKHFLTLLIRAKSINKIEAYKNNILIQSARKRTDRRSTGSVALWKWLCSRGISSLLTVIRKLVAYINYLEHRIRKNTLSGSASNIHEHYDLGNDMFQRFLDPSMTYSCALFQQPLPEITKTDFVLLEEAQMRKYDTMLNELELKPTDSVLEIGCGWGALAVRAVTKYGCRWTGITISKEQLALAQERVRASALEDKIELKLLDYRMAGGEYDKVVAIEMIEAVGHEFLPKFFETVDQRLKPGGVSFIQAITCPDAYYDRYRRSSDFIKKYIFPGGHLPSMDSIRQSLPPQLSISKATYIGPHYATTLDLWSQAWMEREEEILSLGYSTLFHRKWQFYFALCSALFEYGHIDTVHMELSKAQADGLGHRNKA